MEYLQNIYELTYLKDVIERNRLRNVEGLKGFIYSRFTACIHQRKGNKSRGLAEYRR